MDWLKGMNGIAAFIEENLQNDIAYDALARRVGCSVYEFFRIFSFMTGMSLAEYIRRRRLTCAAFDLQNGDDRIIDIALRFQYESPTSFTKAFKEQHGVTPRDARKGGVKLKAFPPLTFKLTIQGVNEMELKIEKRESFTLYGQRTAANVDSLERFKLPTMFAGKGKVVTENLLFAHFDPKDPGPHVIEDGKGGKITITHNDDGTYSFNYTDKDGKVIQQDIKKKGNDISTKFGAIDNREEIGKLPHHFTVAYDYAVQDGKVGMVAGVEKADLHGTDEPGEAHTVPAATWAVFTFSESMNPDNVAAAYTRIQIEWLPTSGYTRNESIPHLERYTVGPNGPESPWEIWLPVVA